jgi:hypothetical protein
MHGITIKKSAGTHGQCMELPSRNLQEHMANAWNYHQEICRNTWRMHGITIKISAGTHGEFMELPSRNLQKHMANAWNYHQEICRNTWSMHGITIKKVNAWNYRQEIKQDPGSRLPSTCTGTYPDVAKLVASARNSLKTELRFPDLLGTTYKTSPQRRCHPHFSRMFCQNTELTMGVKINQARTESRRVSPK